MNIVLAPDSFKGSLSSIQVVDIMSEAIESVAPGIQTALKPMADGGEGTLEALLKAASGEKISFSCTGPLGERSESWYVELENKTAVIECANIAGLQLVPEDSRHPDSTTTYGLGEAILKAIDRGNKEIIVAIGGSSTNDGGIGMLEALGMKAWNKQGAEVGIYGRDIFHVDKLDIHSFDHRLKHVNIYVACDVDNPLTGLEGASHVYGPQKGLSSSEAYNYDKALENYGRLMEKILGKYMVNIPGAGAAGGLGFALMAIGAELKSGARLVGDAIGLKETIENADIVFTGEGQSDEQTLYGKAPGYVAEVAIALNKPVILLSGSLAGDLYKWEKNFSGCFSIVQSPSSLTDCIEEAEDLLYQSTRQLTKLVHHFIEG